MIEQKYASGSMLSRSYLKLYILKENYYGKFYVRKKVSYHVGHDVEEV